MNEARKFINTLKEKELTVAFAESMTCGLAAHKLSTVKGVADVLSGSVVCYTPNVKMKLLRVKKDMICKCTCESQEVTNALAVNLPKLIKADIYGAITGLASEGGSETKEKPVGTVFFSVLYKKKLHRLRRLFRGTPSEIKEKACEALYKFILNVVKA